MKNWQNAINSYMKLFYTTPNEICYYLFNKFQSPKDELSFCEDGFIFLFFAVFVLVTYKTYLKQLFKHFYCTERSYILVTSMEKWIPSFPLQSLWMYFQYGFSHLSSPTTLMSIVVASICSILFFWIISLSHTNFHINSKKEQL